MKENHSNPTVMEAYSKLKQADYTREAPVYDLKRFSTFAGSFYVELTNAILFDLLKVRKREKVLDLATGTGRVSVGLAEKGASIIGVDLTWKMLERARQKAVEKRLQNIAFSAANALKLPFHDNTFDKIISTRFFHILPFSMQKSVIQELKRILKPGGTLIVEFNSPFAGLFLWAVRRDQRVIWPREVKDLFHGLTVVKKRGVMLPGLGKIARVSVKAALRIGRLMTFFPFNYLSNQILIVAKK
ncbi:MAG TPA: class I SAM-dependent methyltransferase [Candidatus Manganitrophaceae bacterium]